MVTRLNAKYDGANFTVQQLNDREQRLKKDHNSVKSVLSKSGFGWNPNKGVPTAPDEKWNDCPYNCKNGDTNHSSLIMMICMKIMKACCNLIGSLFLSYCFSDPIHSLFFPFLIALGKMAEGKNCKRSSDKYSENYCSPSFPENGSFYDQVVSASMESPNTRVLLRYFWGI
jgi:hypothetical protein